MNVTIQPRKLHGSITPPPSKSQSHRLILAAALAHGESRIENVSFSQDISATLSCMEQLGVQWEKTSQDTIRIHGLAAAPDRFTLRRIGDLPHLDCAESGSTLRFVIPIALALCGGGVFSGRGRLMERPLDPYFDLFEEKGIFYRLRDGALTVRAPLLSDIYTLPGGVSSQFFTGLLYALPLLHGTSELRAATALESVDYIQMTLDVLRRCGITCRSDGGADAMRYSINGGQMYAPLECAVEADWSQAAFYYAMQGTGSDLTIEGMNAASTQGDKRIARFAEQLTASGDAELDVKDCPDLVPPLAAFAALRGKGRRTHIVGAARLRYKESDRLRAVTDTLTRMGAKMVEEDAGLLIDGQDTLSGGAQIDSFNDHRIAMMAAVAATGCEKPVKIIGADCVKKSYPGFWDDYEKLGGSLEREG